MLTTSRPDDHIQQIHDALTADEEVIAPLIDPQRLRQELQHPENAQRASMLMLLAAKRETDDAIQVLELLRDGGIEPAAARNSAGVGCLGFCHAHTVDWLLAQGCHPSKEPSLLNETVERYTYGAPDGLDLLSRFIELGLDINRRDRKNDGQTMLMALGSQLKSGVNDFREPRIAQAMVHLMDAGADIHARNRNGANVLVCTIGRHAFDMVVELLRRGARCDPGSLQDERIASIAVEKNRPEALQLLRQQGSDLSAMVMEDEGISLIDAAVRYDTPAVLLWLLDEGIFQESDITEPFAPDLRCERVLASRRAQQAAQAALNSLDTLSP